MRFRPSNWFRFAIALAVFAALAIPGEDVGAQTSAARSSSAKTKFKVTNETECKVDVRFFGEKLPKNGKLRSLKPGKGRNLKLKAPGTRYTWEATAECCTAGTGEFDAPLEKKSKATVTYRCTPPLETVFDVVSKAFEDGATLPDEFTCDGNNSSPPLQIQNVPVGTMSFVLIANDPDFEDGFLHWLLYDIAPGQGQFPGGFQPGDYGVSGLNDASQQGYFGACAPAADDPHRYVFTLYALDIPSLGLPAGATLEQVQAAMAGRVIAEGDVTGLFSRR